MGRKVLHLVLLVGFLVGLVVAWRASDHRTRLERRYRLLVQTAGELLVTDPTQPQFRALSTGEPAHFAWRVYLPANSKQSLRDRFGSGSTTMSSVPSEFIARVRFRENAQGGLDSFVSFGGGFSQSSFASKAVADVLRGRWDRMIVEQVGKTSTTIDPRQPAVLLRLSLPPELHEEVRRAVPMFEQARYVPVLYELTLDPTTP